MDTENTDTHTHTEYYLALIKEGNLPICDTMDETWGHFAKLFKSYRVRQILYNLIYMWNLIKPNSETGSR